MKLFWTQNARDDLERLFVFLAAVNPAAAERLIIQLTKAPKILLDTPRLGTPVARYNPREVRKMISRNYVFHYELTRDAIYVLRIWHGKEDRR